MKQNEMMESRYLKQSDFPEPVLVTVESIKKVNMSPDGEIPEYKWTVKFEEYPKPMAMNATNLKRMFKYCGDDSDDWPGKRVTVYNDEDVEFKGEIVGGLRIKPAPTAARTRPAGDDDVNRKLRDAERDIPF